MPTKKKTEDKVLKNTRFVLDAWQRGEKYRRTLACWTDGLVLWSYNTLLLMHTNGMTYLNVTAYSRYTEVYQQEIRRQLTKAGIQYRLVYDVPLNTNDHGFYNLLSTRGDIASVDPVVDVAEKAREGVAIYGDLDEEVGF